MNMNMTNLSKPMTKEQTLKVGRNLWVSKQLLKTKESEGQN